MDEQQNTSNGALERKVHHPEVVEKTEEPAALWVDVAHLKAWDKNPRDNDKAVPEVMASIKRFGFAAPIIARPNGEIIAGHTRLKAALELRLPRVPVRYMDLDPAEAHLLALADNRVAEIADWNDDLLMDGPEESGADLDAIPDEIPAITKPGEVVTLGRHTLHCGDCIEVMRSLPDASVDAVVTDPPYGIGFMGKGWDCAVPGDDFAAEALRVLKPGGHLIAFAATRTVHRLTVALEDAGLEIRDQIAWVQWQGFPKSHDVSKALDQHHGAEREVVGLGKYADRGRVRSGAQCDAGPSEGSTITAPATEDARTWEGWGTALKPAYEPCVLARKPLEGTVAENVLAHGVGGINIDGCRYAYGDPAWPGPGEKPDPMTVSPRGMYQGLAGKVGKSYECIPSEIGRWPANLYACPKASRGEREAGCDEMDETKSGVGALRDNGRGKVAKNHHPTVKPVQLMRWLVRLVTPPGATVLEPFCGSGTTLLAAEAEGVTCIGIEREPGYCDIIRARYAGLEDA